MRVVLVVLVVLVVGLVVVVHFACVPFKYTSTFLNKKNRGENQWDSFLFGLCLVEQSLFLFFKSMGNQDFFIYQEECVDPVEPVVVLPHQDRNLGGKDLREKKKTI